MPRAKAHTIEEVTLSDILNISVTELLIMQFLIRFRMPILRIVLLESINGIIAGDKTIASSSFYLKLDRMEQLGFITKLEDDKIVATDIARETLNEIQRLTTLATMTDYDLTKEFLPDFVEQLGFDRIDTMLILNLEEGLDARLINEIAAYAENPFMIAEDHVYQNHLARGMDSEIHKSLTLKGKIREPDNFFDIVIILGYDCHEHHSDIDKKTWITEARRVLKKDGVIVISTLEKFPETNNFIIDSIIENLKACKELHYMEKNQLVADMQDGGFKDVKLFEHRGLLLGWSKKSG